MAKRSEATVAKQPEPANGAIAWSPRKNCLRCCAINTVNEEIFPKSLPKRVYFPREEKLRKNPEPKRYPRLAEYGWGEEPEAAEAMRRAWKGDTHAYLDYVRSRPLRHPGVEREVESRMERKKARQHGKVKRYPRLRPRRYPRLPAGKSLQMPTKALYRPS